MLSKPHWILLGAIWIVLGVLVWSRMSSPPKDFYSLTERRMPCGRIVRREVVQHADAWKKTMTLLDPQGRVLATKTRLVEPEHCAKIQAGQFVSGLWRDCQIPM